MATKRLSMRQTREILRQKFVLGRSHREIAGSLGISVGAVGMAVSSRPNIHPISALETGGNWRTLTDFFKILP